MANESLCDVVPLDSCRSSSCSSEVNLSVVLDCLLSSGCGVFSLALAPCCGDRSDTDKNLLYFDSETLHTSQLIILV